MNFFTGTMAGTPDNPIVDTGPVSAGGGHLEASLLDYPVPGFFDPTNGALQAQILHATVVAHGNKSSAEAFVARFSLSTLNQSILNQTDSAELRSGGSSSFPTPGDALHICIWFPNKHTPVVAADYAAGQAVQVVVTAQYHWLGYLVGKGLLPSSTLRATSTMRLEQSYTPGTSSAQYTTGTSNATDGSGTC